MRRAAWVLLRLIALATNLAYFQRLSVAPVSFDSMHLPLWSIAVPVVGSLIVGLIARFDRRRSAATAFRKRFDPFLQTRVEQIMAKPVHTLAASMLVKEAITFFMTEEGNRSHLSYPIVDGDGKFAGMVGRTDVMHWMHDDFEDDATLGDVVNDAPLVDYPSDLAGDIADRMAIAEIVCVPILDESRKVVGLVALRDLMRVRALAIRHERERRRLFRLSLSA
jgi:CBS domain-containing protein